MYNLGWLDVEGVLNWLRTNRPRNLHLVITGRQAPQALIEYADIVTEMRNIKHPYTNDVPAQAGIEF
jgi:cob(I)alamin adenosyltransferase